MNGDILVTKSVSAENVLDEIATCIADDVPEDVAHKIKKAIINAFVGQWVYFPHRLMHVERNRELLERFFKGEARGSLCREYKISRSQFHGIVKAYHQGKAKCAGFGT